VFKLHPRYSCRCVPAFLGVCVVHPHRIKVERCISHPGPAFRFPPNFLSRCTASVSKLHHQAITDSYVTFGFAVTLFRNCLFDTLPPEFITSPVSSCSMTHTRRSSYTSPQHYLLLGHRNPLFRFPCKRQAQITLSSSFRCFCLGISRRCSNRCRKTDGGKKSMSTLDDLFNS